MDGEMAGVNELPGTVHASLPHMKGWGNSPGTDRMNGANGREAAGSAGVSMVLIFGGVALVAVALCALLLLMQRHEQQKLIRTVEGRDAQIGKLESAITNAQALVQEYADRESKAKQELTATQRATENKAEEWKAQRAELEREKQDLQDELDEAKSSEEAAEAAAKVSVKRSEVNKLPARGTDTPCADAQTDFRATPTVRVHMPLRGINDSELAKAVQAGMFAKQVPMLTTPDFEAYIDARASVRFVQAPPNQVSAATIIVQLFMPMVNFGLTEVVWVPAVVDFDEVVAADMAALEAMFRERAQLLTERVIERALRGGPPGELANQRLQAPSATAPTTGGGTSPQGSGQPGGAVPPNPQPGGGTRPPKPSGP
jgi:hypothetical protein